jgi:hypothetical protein
VCWDARRFLMPMCGRAPAPSRTCGWRRGPRAWGWAG